MIVMARCAVKLLATSEICCHMNWVGGRGEWVVTQVAILNLFYEQGDRMGTSGRSEFCISVFWIMSLL